MKGYKKIFYSNGSEKQAGTAILPSDRRDFKTKTVARENRSTTHTIVKGSIKKKRHEEKE